MSQQVAVEHRERFGVLPGHQIRRGQSPAKVIVVGRTPDRGQQNIDRRRRLAGAQSRVGQQHIGERGPRLAAKGKLPDSRRVTVAPRGCQRCAEVERRRKELIPWSGRHLQLGGGLIELSLRVPIEPREKRRSALIAGAERGQGRTGVATRPRVRDRALQLRRARFHLVEHAGQRLAGEDGRRIEFGHAAERQLRHRRGRPRHGGGRRLEDERTDEHADHFAIARHAGARNVPAGRQ